MSDPVQLQSGVGAPLSAGGYGNTVLMRAPIAAPPYAGQSGWKYAAIAGLVLMLARDVPGAMAAGWMPTAVAPPARLGFVATGAAPPDTNASQTFWMTRTAHIATDDISSMQVLWTNFATYGLVTTGTAAINATLEYAGVIVGTFTFYLQGGNTTFTIPAGGYAWTDPLPCAIPKGATFYIRHHRVQSAGNTPTCQGLGNKSCGTDNGAGGNQNGLGECTIGNTVAVTDTTASVGPFASTQNNIPRPAAIIGLTANPSVLILADSRGDGTSDSSYNQRQLPLSRVDTGNIAPSVYNLGLGYCRFAMTGLQAGSGGIMGHVRSDPLLACFLALVTLSTHVINDLGINDLHSTGGNLTAAAHAANQAAIAALSPSANIKWLLTTLGPITTSTDSWATLANQTLDGDNAARVAYNTALRSGNLPAGYVGVYDVAQFYESSLNSGLWVVNGAANYATSDGVHCNSVIYDAVAASGILTANSLSR